MENDQDHKAAFASYIQRSHAQLLSYIYSLVHDTTDADDIFQQTSMVLWRQFDQFDRTRSFLPWACGVARLEVSNYLRTRSRRKLYFTDDFNLMLIEAQTELHSDEADARKNALAQCVQKLRPNDREMLDECYGQNDSIESIAARRGRVPQSIHNTLRRIRRSLFDCIRQTIAQQGKEGFSS